MKDASGIRAEIGKKQKERWGVERSLFRPYPMMPYTLVESYQRCGNKGCRCWLTKSPGSNLYL